MTMIRSPRRITAPSLVGALAGLVLFPLILPPRASGQARKAPDAYVIVGDLDQPWYTEMSHGDAYALAEPLIQRKIAELQKMGYTVKKEPVGTVEIFQRCLQNPRTKAIVWLGHGDPGNPGSVTAFGVSDAKKREKIHIGTDQLRTWAEEKWARARGWDGKSDRDAWLQKKTRSAEQFQRLRAEMQRSSFGLEYGYFHTCYGFDKTDLAKVMMKPDAASRLFGYKGKKYNFDEVGALQAAWLNNKVVVGDPKAIEPQRQQALAAAAGLAGSAVQPVAAKPVSEKKEIKAPTVPETAEAGKREIEKPAAPEKTARADEEDEEIDVFQPPAKTTANDKNKSVPVELEKVDPEKETRQRVRRAKPVEQAGNDEDEIAFKEEAPAPDEEKEEGAAGGPPAATKPQPKLARETNSDNFDGDYDGRLQSGKPFRMKIRDGEVTIIIEDLQLTGRVDKKGHVTAGWQGEVGEIENPNPGSLKIVKLTGRFAAEGDISGKIAAGSLRVEINAAGLGEAPQVSHDRWSGSR